MASSAHTSKIAAIMPRRNPKERRPIHAYAAISTIATTGSAYLRCCIYCIGRIDNMTKCLALASSDAGRREQLSELARDYTPSASGAPRRRGFGQETPQLWHHFRGRQSRGVLKLTEHGVNWHSCSVRGTVCASLDSRFRGNDGKEGQTRPRRHSRESGNPGQFVQTKKKYALCAWRRYVQRLNRPRMRQLGMLTGIHPRMRQRRPFHILVPQCHARENGVREENQRNCRGIIGSSLSRG